MNMKRSLILLCGLLTGFTLQSTKVNAQTQTVANDQKLVYPYTFAPSEGLVNQTEKEHRQEICINGYWDFQPVRLPKEYVQGKGIAPELPLPENDSEWSKTRIKIPSPWNINAFAYRDLEGPDHRNYPSYPKEWEQVKMAWMKKNSLYILTDLEILHCLKIPSTDQSRMMFTQTRQLTINSLNSTSLLPSRSW